MVEVKCMKHKGVEVPEVLLTILFGVFAVVLGFHTGIYVGILTGFAGLAVILLNRIEEAGTVLHFDEDGVEAFLGERQLCFIPWEQFKTAGTFTTRSVCSAYISFLTKEELELMIPHFIVGQDYSINEWLHRNDWPNEVNTRPLFLVPRLSTRKDGRKVLTQLLAAQGKYIQKSGGDPLNIYFIKI